jgi:hypothetical protein
LSILSRICIYGTIILDLWDYNEPAGGCNVDRPDILLDHERRLSTLEGIASETRDTLNRLETRLDERFNSLESRLTIIFVGLASAMIAGFAAVTAAIITS